MSEQEPTAGARRATDAILFTLAREKMPTPGKEVEDKITNLAAIIDRETGLPELLEACRNAKGAYKAWRAVGLAWRLPGIDECEEFLDAALKKARPNKEQDNE